MPCAERGEVQNVAKILREDYAVDGVMWSNLRGACLQNAAAYDHLPLLKFLMSEECGPPPTTEFIGKAVRLSAKRGHYRILQWFLQEGGWSFSFGIWNDLRIHEATADTDGLSSLLTSILKVGSRFDFDFTTDKFFFQKDHRDIVEQGNLVHKYLPKILIEQEKRIATHCPVPTVLSHVIAAYAKLVPEDDVMWAEDMQRDLLRIETDIRDEQRRLKRAHEDAYEAAARRKWANSPYNSIVDSFKTRRIC
jgi:hypothetical protein